MNDSISRQAAIEAIKEDKIDLTNPNIVAVFKATGDFEKAETQVMTCDRHIKILKDLPPAQPERKRGEWIEREVTHIDDLEAKDIITAWQSCKCSVCGRYDTKPYMYYFDAPKYCSWCGAEMEVSE